MISIAFKIAIDLSVLQKKNSFEFGRPHTPTNTNVMRIFPFISIHSGTFVIYEQWPLQIKTREPAFAIEIHRCLVDFIFIAGLDAFLCQLKYNR